MKELQASPTLESSKAMVKEQAMEQVGMVPAKEKA